MSFVVPFIVVIIIALQGFFFWKNWKRMQEYADIFDGSQFGGHPLGGESSWCVVHNHETGFPVGIGGAGNEVFESIRYSINKYLSSNSGSVIEFSLLKDAVDRHCDALEDDIHAQMPVPLYLGLAGTMAGVIVGLFALLTTGSITALLSSGSSDFGTAANGVNELLSGVAWAMVASILGIVLTTWASLLFKKHKQRGESGKNSFLAWLQSNLLPELPSDTSEALNRLVVNLNKFNDTFSSNTQQLGGALDKVNESYKIQAGIIQAVHDMDFMTMARANVSVLRELQACTDKLETFNEYLDNVEGYTTAIHKFTQLFEKESNRLHVMEEIRDYFIRHKGEIAKASGDLDNNMKKAFRSLLQSADAGSTELNAALVKQAETLKATLQEEKESFEAIHREMKAQFSQQLSQMPMLEKRLSAIADIPAHLDKLIARMEQSNRALAANVSQSLEGMAQARGVDSFQGGEEGSQLLFPQWMKWTIFMSLLLIAVACVSNTVYNIWFSDTDRKGEATPNSMYEVADTMSSLAADTIPVVRPQDQ